MPITAPALPWAEPRPGPYFPFRENQIAEGFVVVTFNLTDAGPAHGGFCCIPGSHKSHYRLPRQIAESPERCPFVVVPEVPAGSAILFTEALTHGTAAWHGPHERRSLLYKYCVSHIAWTANRGGAAACHGAHRAAEDPVSRAGRPAPPLPVLVPGDRASP